MTDMFVMDYRRGHRVIACTGEEDARHFPLTIVEDLHLINGQPVWGFRCPICGMLVKDVKQVK